jgi:hypothetical protein
MMFMMKVPAEKTVTVEDMRAYGRASKVRKVRSTVKNEPFSDRGSELNRVKQEGSFSPGRLGDEREPPPRPASANTASPDEVRARGISWIVLSRCRNYFISTIFLMSVKTWAEGPAAGRGVAVSLEKYIPLARCEASHEVL